MAPGPPPPLNAPLLFFLQFATDPCLENKFQMEHSFLFDTQLAAYFLGYCSGDHVSPLRTRGVSASGYKLFKITAEVQTCFGKSTLPLQKSWSGVGKFFVENVRVGQKDVRHSTLIVFAWA